MDTNIAILTGNLAQNPETTDIGSEKMVCEFKLAVQGFSDEVSFFDIQAFGKLGQLCQRYLQRGSRVLLQGRSKELRTTKGDKKKSRVVIIADSVQFLSPHSGCSCSDPNRPLPPRVEDGEHWTRPSEYPHCPRCGEKYIPSRSGGDDNIARVTCDCGTTFLVQALKQSMYCVSLLKSTEVRSGE
jgi:single-strand DNA-binding protein